MKYRFRVWGYERVIKRLKAINEDSRIHPDMRILNERLLYESMERLEAFKQEIIQLECEIEGLQVSLIHTFHNNGLERVLSHT